MYLSKLKIFGFKSFAQKAEVHFPGNGLTAVVGPNGCGKSNIVDSIRWVIGEQRANQLRMSKMQDVIFSGTEDRPAMNMAEVSLVINNDRGLLPTGFSEIQITRRVYRSGDTEYLLNNQECRLKDIQNLFYDTGMGAASYSLMEQRMIDAILSDKAEDRRVLFEEAAGVSKYKQQRKETVRQLERVRLDMERLEDNLRHVRTSVRQHEKQVARAQEWRAVRDRLRSLEVSMATDKYSEGTEHLKLFGEARSKVSDSQSSLQSRLTLLETQLQEKRLSISGEEEDYRGLETQVQDANRQIQEMNSQCALLRSQRQNLETNVRRFREEISQSEEQIASLAQQREEGERFISNLESSGDLVPELERLEETCQVLRDKVEELKEQRRLFTQTERQARDDVSRLKTRWERVDAELGQLQIQSEALVQEQASLSRQREEISAEIVRQTETLSEKQAAQNLSEEQLQVLDGRLEEAREAYKQADQRDRELDRERIALQSRHDALEHMRHAGAGLDAGARWALENRADVIIGSLADQLKVRDHLPEVEFCLGWSMQALALKSPEQATTLLDALDAAKAGRVGLALPHFANSWSRPEIPQDSAIVSGVRDLVDSPAEFVPLVDWLLGRWILVTDFAAALRLASTHAGLDLWFVAPAGRAVHTSGLVRGGQGKGDGAGILARKVETEEIQQKLTLLQNDIQQVRNALQSHQEQVEELNQQRDSLVADRQEHVSRAREADASLRVARAREQALLDQSSRLDKSLADLAARQERSEAERLSDQELAEAESRLRQCENDLTRVTSEQEELELQLHGQEDDLRAIKSRQQETVMQLSNGRQALKGIDQQLDLHRKILENREAEIHKADQDIDRIVAALTAVEEQIQIRNEGLGEVESRRDAAKQKYDVLVGALEEWNDEIRKVNAQLREQDAQLRDIEQRVLTLKANHDRLKERIFEAWEFDLDHPAEFSCVEYDEQDSPREVRELKAKLKEIGPVNASVMEDYEAEKKRLQEVETQFDDLDRARSSLERTIEKLDKIARERFLDTFRQIQRNFQDVFSSMMIGGEGKLTLQEDTDPLEAEIEVNARPTGKKMRGVRALSGGERALTATSLLFAL
ncbi:MAG TPA: chromosome segregation protein SMC, partial [Fibrobacteraceae bacterium]|nr:chromosome segregation protein SMC [Fibrobacteraceae bacterium]